MKLISSGEEHLMKRLCKEKDILPMREQFKLCDEILKDRLQNLMPQLMKECGVEMWLIICSEYNEDPVFKTITPARMRNASRLVCLIFSLDKDGKYEALNLSRPNPAFSPYYTHCYDPKTQNQWEAIKKAVLERNPSKVAVNVSRISAQADGISKRLWDDLYEQLGDRMVADDRMAIRWLETRSQRELELYPSIYRIAQEIQREAYSLDVITPGVTTTDDVEYYIMQRINDMGLDFWFSPDVDVQRPGSDARMSGVVIEKGDLLHTDMGLTYLNLNTDSQRLGYILKDGETEIPKGLLDGFKRGNRFQDIVRENCIKGRTGNEIFFASMEQAEKEGIRAMLYTHPIGFYGHAAGPSFGMYDNQGFVPGHGELKLNDDTCYALELNVTEYVPEWGQDVRFMMEETISFTGGETYFNDDYRDQIILVK
ncbi:MAG: aminopeptidase P family protein [Ruminococcaceae bacterium]|nr:aminopeptidase P family protein [Oscillospiraceae bacterium]